MLKKILTERYENYLEFGQETARILVECDIDDILDEIELEHEEEYVCPDLFIWYLCWLMQDT